MQSSVVLPAFISLWDIKRKFKFTASNFSFVIFENDRCVQQACRGFIEKVDRAIVGKNFIPDRLKVGIVDDQGIRTIAFLHFHLFYLLAGGIYIIDNADI